MNETLLNAIAVVGAGVTTVVGGMLVQMLRKLAAKYDLQATAQDQDNTEAQIAVAIKAGVSQVLPKIQAEGWNSSDVHDEVLKIATNYLAARFPDKTAQIVASAQTSGATPIEAGSPAAKAAVSETIAARLPEVITQTAYSPATPSIQADPAAPPMVAVVATPVTPVVTQ